MNKFVVGFVVLVVLPLTWSQWYIQTQERTQVEAQVLKAYQDGYDDGIGEGIRRAQAKKTEELPLPVDDEPGCDLTPEPPKRNYLERLRTK